MARHLHWRKSRKHSGDKGACVEIAEPAPNVVKVRDSKDPNGPHLQFNGPVWLDFIADVQVGRHNT